MATAILPHLPQDAECILEGLIDQAWVQVEALRLARNAVKLNIRDRGLKLKDFEAKEITNSESCGSKGTKQSWLGRQR
jgi:hypothetical protein